jgi:GNAT superfamily N-acetyltransferase
MTTVKMEQSEGFIRPFDPFQDIEPVVELIGVAFGDRLDPAGRATLAQMRRFAQGGPVLQWLWALLGKTTVTPGLVWVEDERVVGNVSLRRARSRGGYLIGNVVVHPEWRGQGIASALMRAAVDRVSQRGARWIGLEVRADNDVARGLYEGLDFREVGRTLHMLRPAGILWEGRSSSPEVVRRGRGRDGDALVELMHDVVPEEHRPLLEVVESDYRPGWERTLGQWLRGEREAWWVVEADERICGAVRAVRRVGRFPNQLEILVKPGEGDPELVLVKHGLESLNGSPNKPVEVSLPAATDPLIAALEDEGFQEVRVLVQMKRSLSVRISVTMRS